MDKSFLQYTREFNKLFKQSLPNCKKLQARYIYFAFYNVNLDVKIAIEEYVKYLNDA